jgi:hypothetical protein
MMQAAARTLALADLLRFRLAAERMSAHVRGKSDLRRSQTHQKSDN